MRVSSDRTRSFASTRFPLLFSTNQPLTVLILPYQAKERNPFFNYLPTIFYRAGFIGFLGEIY